MPAEESSFEPDRESFAGAAPSGPPAPRPTAPGDLSDDELPPGEILEL